MHLIYENRSENCKISEQNIIVSFEPQKGISQNSKKGSSLTRSYNSCCHFHKANRIQMYFSNAMMIIKTARQSPVLKK